MVVKFHFRATLFWDFKSLSSLLYIPFSFLVSHIYQQTWIYETQREQWTLWIPPVTPHQANGLKSELFLSLSNFLSLSFLIWNADNNNSCLKMIVVGIKCENAYNVFSLMLILHVIYLY